MDVYYINGITDEKETKANVCSWFYDLSAVDFISYNGEMDFYDVGIATWWETAYILKDYGNNFRCKFYFVHSQNFFISALRLL